MDADQDVKLLLGNSCCCIPVPQIFHHVAYTVYAAKYDGRLHGTAQDVVAQQQHDDRVSFQFCCRGPTLRFQHSHMALLAAGASSEARPSASVTRL